MCESVAATVQRLLDHPHLLAEMRACAHAVARPRAAFEIAEQVISDYTNRRHR
jgi:processive 1,2-diacylglycerol beta-glucosyltransferase